MTEHEPQPAGDTLTAYRRTLRRAHKAEQRNRELLARINILTAQIDAQDSDA